MYHIMTGKILFTIISGPKDINKARWGLRMALNTFTHPYGEKLIDEVRARAAVFTVKGR